RPVVRPSGSGLSGRPKARSPQPGSSGRHTVQPPDLHPELSYHGSGSLVWAPVSWFVSSHADGLVRYQGDWSAPKTGGSSGLIGGCQVLFFDSDMRSVFTFGHHPD
ncbi:hypothetical protein U1Q18_017974, partial [Sarracenia purpurea var. burkii]